MILRRIKAHIEKENWFAVGIDFCIVVVGVFFGIQVANWNETRLNDQRQQIYLERLDTEFEVVEARINSAISVSQEGRAAAAYLIDALQRGPEAFPAPNGKGPGTLFWHMMRNTRPASPPAAFKELVANGDLSLIQNETLRATLYEFDAISEVALVASDRNITGMERLRQLMSSTFLFDNDTIMDNFHRATNQFETTANELKGSFIPEQFFGNDELLAGLNLGIVYTANNESLARQQKSVLDRIQILLDEELSP